MAKVTIKDLQEQLVLVRAINDKWIEEVDRKNKEIENLKSNQGVVSQKEYDSLKKDYSHLQERYKHLEVLYNKCMDKKTLIKINNERGAGRKQIQVDYELIKGMRTAGRTIKDIAEELKLSIATIKRILKRNQN